MSPRPTLRRATAADAPGVLRLIDSGQGTLRWLASFVRHLDLLPSGRERDWGLWVGETTPASAPSPADAQDRELSLVIAWFLAEGSLYVQAAPGVDLGVIDLLLDEAGEGPPLRIVGDRPVLERWRSASPELFAAAEDERAIEVLRLAPGGPPPALPEGFRLALPADVAVAERLLELFADEEGLAEAGDAASLIDHELLYLLEREGIVIGVARSNLSDGAFVHGGGLFVHPDFRGRGHGRDLAAGLAHEVLRRQGVRLILDAFADNEPALRAYRAAGFERLGEGLEVRF